MLHELGQKPAAATPPGTLMLETLMAKAPLPRFCLLAPVSSSSCSSMASAAAAATAAATVPSCLRPAAAAAPRPVPLPLRPFWVPPVGKALSSLSACRGGRGLGEVS